MEPAHRGCIRWRTSADEIDERGGARIDWDGGHVSIPPVTGREHLAADERLVEHWRRRGMHDDHSASERYSSNKSTHGHVRGSITDRAAENVAAKSLTALVFAENPGEC